MSLLLPEGTRLLHIGPAKTGTTTLQSAFHGNRAALAEHGVHYAGSGTQPRAAAGAVALGRRIAGHRAGLEAWPRLVQEIADAEATRVVVSSETFARAGDERAADVIEALGADRTHVVITMRPLADMLPSSWQQYVQTGSRTPYPEWLEQMLLREDTVHGEQPEFWQKTRIDVLARRWSALVGPDHVTVVSLAAAPRDFVLRTFERLTGLPEGLLVPTPGTENVSLSHAATEVLRRFNERFFELAGADADVQARVVEFGAVRQLRAHPDLLQVDGRIELPRWAADRATVVMQEVLDGVRAARVRTVGDLDALLVPSRPPVEAVTTPSSISTETAAGLLIGMMLAAGGGVPVFPPVRPAPAPKRVRTVPTVEDLDRVRTRALLRYAAGRVVRRARRR